ncbi:MAG: IS200/IS605 family transposase [Planctomycetaceae bacterium]|nr:IS200/IS605 family transposase [Planctomycetaceae bacterium]
MSQSFAKFIAHVVYSTKNREPILAEPIRQDLYNYTAGILNTVDCMTLGIGGTSDHVHVLVQMSRTMTLAKMVEEMKRGTSRWIKTRGTNFQWFSWQGGYGAFSVSESQLTLVKQYIANQEEHHRKKTFQDEFRTLLKKHNIAFDEKYIWG